MRKGRTKDAERENEREKKKRDEGERDVRKYGGRTVKENKRKSRGGEEMSKTRGEDA